MVFYTGNNIPVLFISLKQKGLFRQYGGLSVEGLGVNKALYTEEIKEFIDALKNEIQAKIVQTKDKKQAKLIAQIERKKASKKAIQPGLSEKREQEVEASLGELREQLLAIRKKGNYRFYRPIPIEDLTEDGIQWLSSIIYGKDFQAGNISKNVFGENNVQAMLHGTIKLVPDPKQKKATAYELIGSEYTQYQPNLPTEETPFYRPVILARPDLRDDLGVIGYRITVYPIGHTDVQSGEEI